MKCCSFFVGLWLLVSALTTPALAQPDQRKFSVEREPSPDYVPDWEDSATQFKLPPVLSAEPAPAQYGVGIEVNQLSFRGNTVFDTEELTRFARPYIAHLMTGADIEMLRQALSRYYVDRGYINSGLRLDEPAFEGETLRFSVFEGRLTQLHVTGIAGLDERYLSERILEKEDTPLNMRHLRERFELLLDDPLFNQLNARLMPGLNPGEAVLNLRVERARPYQLSAFLHNARPPSIGAEAVGMAGWVRNLTGYGDLLRAGIEIAEEGDTINGHNISWTVPLNFRGTELHLGWDRSDSVLVEPPLDELNIESELEERQIGVGHTLTKSLRHRLAIGLDYVEKENQTELLGASFSFIANEPSGETRADSWRTWQEYSYRTEARVLALRSTFAWTDTNLVETEFEAPMVRYPDRDYRFWVGQFHYAQRLTQAGLQLVIRSTIQLTGDRLLALDGMSVGGVNSVRGYRENQLIRDNGLVVNTELHYPVWMGGSGRGELTLVPFIDFGRGENTGGSSEDLSSVGIALRYRYRGLKVDVSVAEKISNPGWVDDQSGDLQDKGVNFRVSYALFQD